MCGIGGEFRFDGQTADVAATARMTDRMADRGPNGSGLWASGRSPSATAGCRSSTCPCAGRSRWSTASSGSRPSSTAASTTTSSCARSSPPAGYRFFSTSDTEVILKAYAEWGGDCVRQFAGMFAFAVFERDSGRLVLARDRLGIKPLYLSSTPHRLRFASTLPALVAGGDVDTSVDNVALHHYLSFHSVVPPPRTIYAGVTKLPPATVRTVEPDRLDPGRDVLAALVHPRPAGAVRRRLACRRPRRAAGRGQAADGRRRAGRRAAVGRARLEPDRRPAGRRGAGA